MINFFKASLLFLSLLCLLTGCTLFSPVKNENATVYLINSSPKNPPQKPKSGLNILVLSPETNAVYNTLQIAYSTEPYQIDYYLKSHWAETPSQMLHPLIIESLQNTHYYHAIGTTATIGHYDFVLNTQLIELKQDYSKRPPSLHFVLRAELIRMSDSRVIATKEFSVAEPLPQPSPYGGVIAANQATVKILNRLTAFCLNKT